MNEKITLELSRSQIQNLIWAIDLSENALEDLDDKDLERMGFEVDRSELFSLAVTLEWILKNDA